MGERVFKQTLELLNLKNWAIPGSVFNILSHLGPFHHGEEEGGGEDLCVCVCVGGFKPYPLFLVHRLVEFAPMGYSMQSLHKQHNLASAS